MFRPKKLSDNLLIMSSQFNIFVISFYVVDFVRDKQIMGILNVASHHKKHYLNNKPLNSQEEHIIHHKKERRKSL